MGDKDFFACLGAIGHGTAVREADDYYATPPEAVDQLFGSEYFTPPPDAVWECACGGGHMAEALKAHGVKTYCTDLRDRGYGTGGVDFLNSPLLFDVDTILTNPPYKYATDFVLHALEILPDQGRVIMFLKTTFLEGKDRWNRLYSVMPPTAMYQFVERQRCGKNGDFVLHGNNAISYAWFEWQKGNYNPPRIHWLK